MTRTLIALALFGLVSSAPSAQAPPNAKFEALAALTEAKMREYHVPGVAIGVLDNGVITSRGLGVTNVNNAQAVTAETVFPIASISKTFAATMVMRLVEQGKIDLKAPVRKYLPEFKVRDENVSRDVTVWNLLTHTAGWEGQVSGPERGEDTLRNFVATVMPESHAGRATGGGVELQQRRLQRVGARHRSGHRHVDQPGDRVAGLPATRPEEPPARPPATSSSTRLPSGTSSRGNEPAGMMRPFSPSVSVTAGGVGLGIDGSARLRAIPSRQRRGRRTASGC
jgi:hypothetical protein